MAELFEQSIRELSGLIRSRKLSSVELTRAYLDRIHRLEHTLHAFVALHDEDAFTQAAMCDARLAKGEAPESPLFGLPFGIKDNMCVKGWEVTCASKILKGFVAPYDATVVERLKSAGAVLVGLCNMDEFAMGSSTENSSYGPTKNPWNVECVPGGSSGGSAASVAAGFCAASLGSDTGGSIPQPAAFCNVIGFKPTYGRVSRYGLIAFASSLDQIGPLTSTAWDCAAVYDAIAGHDRRDSTSLPQSFEPTRPGLETSSSSRPLAGVRVGVPDEYFGEGIDQEVQDSVRRGIDQLAALGAACERVSLPHTRYGLSTYYLIAPAEASSNLARYDGVHFGRRADGASSYGEMVSRSRGEGFGAEVKRRILIGTYVLSAGYYDAYYARALKIRTLIKKDFDEAFQRVDVLAAPTAPTPPFRFGERAQNPLQMYMSDVLTIPTNLAGLPAVSIPGGFSASGLPIGLQLIGKSLGEGPLLKVAHAYEQATEWHTKRPKL